MEANVYAALIATGLFLRLAVGAAADLLNVKALRRGIPRELGGLFDDAAYRRSQEYTRVRTGFGLVRECLGLTALFLFWLAGGFAFVDGLARGAALGPVGTGLIFIGSLALLSRLFSLPFSAYSTFVIEERFGFNRTDPGTFAKDLCRGTALGGLLGVPLVAGVIALFENAGQLAWLYCWLGVTAYALSVQFVAPAWILPLFNRFTPLEEGDLRARILEFARSVDFPLEEIFVMDGSRRSGKANAFFTGFGKHRRIALFDTLIEQQSAEEVVAVLAHEIGHYRKRHVLQGMVLSIAHTGVVLYLFGLAAGAEGLFGAFGIEAPSVHAGMVFFGLLLAPLELPLTALLCFLSRRNEYAADRFAAERTGRPQALGEALKKLAAHNLANLTPHPFAVALSYSHPPLLQRIRALRESAAP